VTELDVAAPDAPDAEDAAPVAAVAAPEEEGVAAGLSDDVAAPDSAPEAAVCAAFGLDGCPELRKSVTYQPEPFSENPAAVSCRASRACPHSGQSRSGGSDNFCRASFWNPQFSHRYG